MESPRRLKLGPEIQTAGGSICTDRASTAIISTLLSSTASFFFFFLGRFPLPRVLCSSARPVNGMCQLGHCHARSPWKCHIDPSEASRCLPSSLGRLLKKRNKNWCMPLMLLLQLLEIGIVDALAAAEAARPQIQFDHFSADLRQ